jgi:hypothetical protein
MKTIMTTSIRISNDTRKRLMRYGRKGETYDFLINNLLDIIEEERYNNTVNNISE